MIQGRQSEAHIQSIILMKMGGEFDSPKSLYQAHYNDLLSRLLELNSKKAKDSNILRRYQAN
jgi:hypothetical protein